jgi:hypothetical protein
MESFPVAENVASAASFSATAIVHGLLDALADASYVLLSYN